jgi:hypothetical protein
MIKTEGEPSKYQKTTDFQTEFGLQKFFLGLKLANPVLKFLETQNVVGKLGGWKILLIVLNITNLIKKMTKKPKIWPIVKVTNQIKNLSPYFQPLWAKNI